MRSNEPDLIHHSSFRIHHLPVMPASISEYVPQLVTDDESPRRGRVAWCAVLAGAASLVGLIVAAPLLRAAGALSAAQAIYGGVGLGGHPQSARPFHLRGYPPLGCARR